MPETIAPSTPERALPHNLEAETPGLGAILIHNEPSNHGAELIDSRDFFRDAHRRIFDKMVSLSERNDAIDFVTLKEELARSGELEEVGGPAYIASLADGVPRSANVEHYARIVKEKATLRNLIHSANRILSDAYRAEEDAEVILDGAEKAIFEIAEDRIREGFVPLRDLVQSSFATIEKLQQHKGLVTGVPTGFIDLDEMTSGLQPSDLVLVAARPSMGKTSFVLNIAQHVGTQTDMTVGFFSLEMSKEQLFMRMLTAEARITARSSRTCVSPAPSNRTPTSSCSSSARSSTATRTGSRIRRPKGSPRSSSASSATARSARPSWRSSRNTRASRTWRKGRHEGGGRPPTLATRSPRATARPCHSRAAAEAGRVEGGGWVRNGQPQPAIVPPTPARVYLSPIH